MKLTFPAYSYLNASTGSNRAARLAGYRPKPTPVGADAASAATMDQSGTFAGIGGAGATARRIHPFKYGTCLTKAPWGTPTNGGVLPEKRLGGGVYTPITVKGTPAMWIVWPIGSRPRNS